jgi:hypothetical protein
MSAITKKLWVKFDELDIECFCEADNKKCLPEEKPTCKEYVVKFIEIKRDEKLDKFHQQLDETSTHLELASRRLKSEFNRTMKHLNRRIKL